MINLTRLWTGHDQPADGRRYGTGPNAAATAGVRKPIVFRNITRTCNLRCVHCYSDSMAAQYPGELDWPQMQALVRDLAGHQIPSLLLSGGEPEYHLGMGNPSENRWNGMAVAATVRPRCCEHRYPGQCPP